MAGQECKAVIPRIKTLAASLEPKADRLPRHAASRGQNGQFFDEGKHRAPPSRYAPLIVWNRHQSYPAGPLASFVHLRAYCHG